MIVTLAYTKVKSQSNYIITVGCVQQFRTPAMKRINL